MGLFAIGYLVIIGRKWVLVSLASSVEVNFSGTIIVDALSNPLTPHSEQKKKKIDVSLCSSWNLENSGLIFKSTLIFKNNYLKTDEHCRISPIKYGWDNDVVCNIY